MPSVRLAADVRAWIAGAREDLTGAINCYSGPETVAAALAQRVPESVELVSNVIADGRHWAEVTIGHGAAAETGIHQLRTNGDGAVVRIVHFRRPLVPPSPACDRQHPAAGHHAPTGSSPSGGPRTHVGPYASSQVPDARTLFENYFDDLMHARFKAAAEHFTTDVIYSHPPYHGAPRAALFSGRDALHHGFANVRGVSPARQVITDFCQRGPRVFIEGVIEGISGGSFFATAEVSADLQISRYVAFYSARRVSG